MRLGWGATFFPIACHFHTVSIFTLLLPHLRNKVYLAEIPAKIIVRIVLDEVERSKWTDAALDFL